MALELGMHYPSLVQALVIGAAGFRFGESYHAAVQHMGIAGPGAVQVEETEANVPELVALWRHVHTLGPDHWKRLLQQISHLWLTPFAYTAADFARVGVPTLILTGDRDQFHPVEEAVELFRLLPHAELLVVPGADHGLPFNKADLLTQLLIEFLVRQQPPSTAYAQATTR